MKAINVKKRKESGFTLIEIIVVIVLMAISASFVMARLGNSIPGARLKSVVREIAATMRYMKSKAQLHGKDEVLTLNLDDRSFSFDGKKKAFPKEIKATFIDPDNGETDRGQWQITFYPEGGSSGGEIILTDSKRYFTITVDPVVGSVVSTGKPST